MAIELRKIGEQGRDLWGRLTPGRRYTLLAAGVATVALAAFLTIRPTSEDYAVLFSNLSPDDAGKVLEQLKAQTVPYRLEHNGTTIEVPASKVHETRLTLASTGLPRGAGIGYELFDKQTFGTTSFVEQMNYRRALQGELARTVMSLDAVDKARVHIAMRERSLYRDDDEPPSASVVVQLKPGHTLTKPQVQGVVHLVASSVEGLKPDRVTLVDEEGNVLWSADANSSMMTDVEQRRELEKTLAHRVTDIVEKVVGPGHTVVAVTAELDPTSNDRTEETFDKDKIALRSEARLDEKTSGPPALGGVAGAQGNLPGAPAPPVVTPPGSPGNSKLSETRNYEVNHTVSHTLSPKSRLKKLHVAVLLDGVATGGKGAEKMVPRSDQELTHIASLAKEAAGLDTDRGDRIEVRSVPFFVSPVGPEAPPVAAPVPLWPPTRRTLLIAGGAAAALLLALVALLLLRRRRSTAAQQAEISALPTLPVPVEELEASLAGEQASASGGMSGERPAPVAPTAMELAPPTVRDRAMAAAREDAIRAARVLSVWLSEGAVEERNNL